MKLSISTLGCPNWSFDKMITEFSKLGVQGIEVRGIDGVMDFDAIPELCGENIGKTLEILKKNKLEFVCFGASSSFHEREKHEKNIAEAKATIDAAKRCGVPYIRVFGNNVSAEAPDESLENIIDGIAEVCRYAEDKGVVVNLEIHGDINTPERLAKVIGALKCYKSFGIIWDICHTFTSCGNDISEVYEVIKPYVRHVHIKDAVREDGKTQLRSIGEGDINIEGIIKLLLDDGYCGFFSFEHEKKWHKELPEPETEFPKFVEYIKKLNI